jgi:hypothetical protein
MQSIKSFASDIQSAYAALHSIRTGMYWVAVAAVFFGFGERVYSSCWGHAPDAIGIMQMSITALAVFAMLMLIPAEQPNS